jgi:hypothetical protein
MRTLTTPTAAETHRLANLWIARYPELDEHRVRRAEALVDNVTPGRLDHVFFVEGSDGHRYIVRVDEAARTSTCDCPDSTERGAHCKHRLAVALVVALQPRQLKLPLKRQSAV